MRITFRRFPDHAAAYSVIERDDGVVYHMREFTRAGTGLPHDLRHLVAERELGIADGIWGGIADGAVYRSMTHVHGRRPPHAAERSDALKRAQRDRLLRAELLANLVEAVAVLPEPTAPRIDRLARERLSVIPVTEPGADPAALIVLPPAADLAAAARTLQVEAARWARLRPGEELVYEWRPRAGPRAPASGGPAPVTPLPGPGLPGPGLRAVPWPREAAGRRDPRHPAGRRPR
jgi:hypothetical protein